MRKKISFVVLSNSGSSIKQITISATFLRLSILAFLICIGIFTYDYYSLKTAGIDTLERDIRIANQSDEIIHQLPDGRLALDHEGAGGGRDALSRRDLDRSSVGETLESDGALVNLERRGRRRR